MSVQTSYTYKIDGVAVTPVTVAPYTFRGNHDPTANVIYIPWVTGKTSFQLEITDHTQANAFVQPLIDQHITQNIVINNLGVFKVNFTQNDIAFGVGSQFFIEFNQENLKQQGNADILLALEFSAVPSITATTTTVTYPNTKTVQAPSASSVSNSSGALTYSLAAGAPSGSSINASGLVTIGNAPGTIVVQATQAASGNYSAITTPVRIQTITVQAIPVITSDVLHTVSYTGSSTPKITIVPKSTSPGSFNFSLAAGAPSGSSVDSSGNVTIGGVGSITVLATQNAASGYIAVTTAQTVGSITVLAGPSLSTKTNQSVPYGTQHLDCSITSNSSGTKTYFLGPSTTNGSIPTGTSIANSSSGIVTLGSVGSFNVYFSQTASGNYGAIKNQLICTVTVTPILPTITAGNATILYGSANTYQTPKINSNSAGVFTYSLLSGFPSGTSIDKNSGNIISIGGPGTITVLVTQMAAGNYSAITNPVQAFTLNVSLPTPAITGKGNVTLGYPGAGNYLTFDATSQSSGTLIYALASQPTPPSGTTIDPLTGHVYPGGLGSIQVTVTQEKSVDGKWNSVTTPVVLGTITVVAGTPTITQFPYQQLNFTGPQTFVIRANSTSPGTLTYSLAKGPGAVTSDGTVFIQGPGTITVNVSQAATSDGLWQSISNVTAAVINVTQSEISLAKSFLSPTYIGDTGKLYLLPNDNLVVQPSGLAVLTRSYACAVSYASAARGILIPGSTPYTPTGAQAWPNMWMFRKPTETSDGLVVTFQCQYYGVRDSGDFYQIYQVNSTEIRTGNSNVSFGTTGTNGAASTAPISYKYISPIVTQTWVQKTSDPVSIKTATLPFSVVSLFEVMINDGGTTYPLSSFLSSTQALAASMKSNFISSYQNQLPLIPSIISQTTSNFGTVSEITVKTGAIVDNGALMAQAYSAIAQIASALQ